MNLQYLVLAFFIIQSLVLIIAMDISDINDNVKHTIDNIDNNDRNNDRNSLTKILMKRVEEVPNYGFLKDDEDLDYAVIYDSDGMDWNDDQIKRSRSSLAKSTSDTMKTCMLYVTHLLNLICDTDNWMATSHYRNSDKRRIKMKCCLSPCSMSSLKMHCKRRTESEAKHQLTPMAMLLRPDIAERLPTLPKDNNEIEKAKYSITPNGFFGAFHP